MVGPVVYWLKNQNYVNYKITNVIHYQYLIKTLWNLPDIPEILKVEVWYTLWCNLTLRWRFGCPALSSGQVLKSKINIFTGLKLRTWTEQNLWLSNLNLKLSWNYPKRTSENIQTKMYRSQKTMKTLTSGIFCIFSSLIKFQPADSKRQISQQSAACRSLNRAVINTTWTVSSDRSPQRTHSISLSLS